MKKTIKLICVISLGQITVGDFIEGNYRKFTKENIAKRITVFR